MNWKTGVAGVSTAGVLLIAVFEGFAPTASAPLPGDVQTVGFGHTRGVKAGDKVTLEQAMGILKEDVAVAAKTVRASVTYTLNQDQFDALTSLVFNIGSLAFAKSTLLERLNAGDLNGVAVEWMRWKYFNGQPVKGLENRRAAELAVFMGKQIQAVVGNRLCFGSAGCFSYSELLQKSVGSPDGATYGT